MNTYRFRNRLPKAGEGKSPRAQLDATRDAQGIVTLWFYDVIDSWGGFWGISADEVREALDEFPPSQVSEIHIHVNSPGGEVFEAAAINNILAAHPAKVKVMVDGLAASAASVIGARADELIMGIGTEIMIHDAWTIAIGPAADLRSAADLADKISDDLAVQYAMKAGGDPQLWRDLMLAETWYTADEAVASGLADRVGTLIESEPVQSISTLDDDSLEDVDDGDELDGDDLEALLLAASLSGVAMKRARAALARGTRPARALAAQPSPATPVAKPDTSLELEYAYRAKAAARR